MFGVLFATAGTFFGEISSSIGKFEVQAKKESIFTMGFLNSFWSLIFFGVLIYLRGSFVFSLASLPTFTVRAILEILQLHITLLAIVNAERTAYNFIRTITIPLLLLVDIILGYNIAIHQLLGIVSIFVGILILFKNHGIERNGLGFVLFTSINAVATISLYKYNISHFNSVEGEQFVLLIILLLYLAFGAKFFAKENPIKFFKKPIFFIQSFSDGLGATFLSFAYLFAPASIILSAKRSLSIAWSLFSGKIYFHEQHIAIKIVSTSFLILGIILLI